MLNLGAAMAGWTFTFNSDEKSIFMNSNGEDRHFSSNDWADLYIQEMGAGGTPNVLLRAEEAVNTW